MNPARILSLTHRFMVRVFLLVVIVGVATASSGASQENDEWNLFRRDAALTGVLPDGALADALVPIWMFETGDSIESTAAIADGRVYFGSLDRFFYALDLKTGEEIPGRSRGEIFAIGI